MATAAPPNQSSNQTLDFKLHDGQPPLIGDLTDVPTFYVDDLRGVVLRHGVVKLTFTENQLDHTDGQLKTRLVLNVAIGAAALPALMETLGSINGDIVRGLA